MAQHQLAAVTISERLEQLELDLTAVYDAISRLAERIYLIEEAIANHDR